jgi:DNA replication protein DnaC
VNLTQLAWTGFEKKFDETFSRIQKRVNRIKEKAEALNLRQQHQSQSSILRELKLQTDATEYSAVFPCHNMPFPINYQFFGRSVELETISKALSNDGTNPKFRSLAVWGMAGVGKTQLAIKFAYDQYEKGVQFVCWINSETELEIEQGFTKVASLLRLPGAVPNGNHTNNRFLVLKWLQNTGMAFKCLDIV